MVHNAEVSSNQCDSVCQNQNMSTTKRKHEAIEDDEELVNVKRMKIDNTSLVGLYSLMDELLMQIFLDPNLFFWNRSELRLVCSRWRRLTSSTLFAKLLCINAFGSDIAPMKLTCPSQLSVTDSHDLVLIPTKTEGSLTVVDWFRYFEIRFAVAMAIRNFLLTTNIRTLVQHKGGSFYFLLLKLPSDRELTDANLRGLINNGFGFNILFCNGYWLARQIIPLLIQYKRNDLARRLIEQLLDQQDNMYQKQIVMSNLPREVRAMLRLVDTCRIYFPELMIRAHKLAIKYVRLFLSYSPSGDVGFDFHERVLTQAITSMIQIGATMGPLKEDKKFLGVFKQPWDGCYVILQKGDCSLSKQFHERILATCSEEFENSSDWRIQTSALTVLHAFECNHGDFNIELIKFGLKVLDNHSDCHPEVKRAAFYCAFNPLLDDIGIEHIPTDLHPVLMNYAIEAIEFLPKEDSPSALHALVQVLNSKDPLDGCLTEETLDKLNHGICNVILTPEVTTNPQAEVIVITSAIVFLLLIAGMKYMDELLAALVKLTLHTQSQKWSSHPYEMWLALYTDIAMVVLENYSASAKQMVTAIDNNQNVSIGKVSIKFREAFYACCENALELTSLSFDATVEKILGVFPQFILKRGLDFKKFKDHSGATVLKFHLKLDDWVERTEPYGEKPPEYVPDTYSQWIRAKRFQQREGKTAQPDKFMPPQDTIVRTERRAFNDGVFWFGKEFYMSNFEILLLAPECFGAYTKIMQLTEEKKANKHAKKFLRVLIMYLAIGMTTPQLLKCIVLLFEALTLNDRQWMHFSGIVFRELLEAYISHQNLLIVDDFITCVFLILRKRVQYMDPNVMTSLVRLITKIRTAKAEANMHNRSDIERPQRQGLSMETLVDSWPRAAWYAFNCLPACTSDWLLHLKLYGAKRLAAKFNCNDCLQAFLPRLIKAIQFLENPEHRSMNFYSDEVLQKRKLLIELCQIDPDIGEVNYFNQFLFDQHKIKNALIKANKFSEEMEYYSELLF